MTVKKKPASGLPQEETDDTTTAESSALGSGDTRRSSTGSGDTRRGSGDTR